MTQNLKRIAVGAGALATSATAVFAADEISIRTPTGFFDNMGTLISGLLNFVIIIAALLVFIYLLWGGIEWITSGGDKGKTESARNKITSAIIGLIVLAAAWALLTIILNFLGYDNLQQVFNLNIEEATSRNQN